MTMLKQSQQVGSSIPKHAGNVYSFPAKAVIEATEDSPTSIIEAVGNISQSSSTSSGCIERCLDPELRTQNSHHQIQSPGHSGSEASSKFKSVFPDSYYQGWSSREVQLETNRYAIEETIQVNFLEKNAFKKGSITASPDVSAIMKKHVSVARAFSGPPGLSRGIISTKAASTGTNYTDIIAVADYNFLRSSPYAARTTQTAPRLLPQPSQSLTKSTSGSKNSLNIRKAKPSLVEAPVVQVKATSNAVEIASDNHVCNRSRYEGDASFGSSNTVDYPNTLSRTLAVTESAAFRAGLEPSSQVNTTDESKSVRVSHNRYSAGQGRKVTVPKASPSKWNDAGKWVSNAESSPTHSQLRASYSSSIVVINDQPLSVTVPSGNGSQGLDKRSDSQLYFNETHELEIQNPPHGGQSQTNKSLAKRKFNPEQACKLITTAGKIYLLPSTETDQTAGLANDPHERFGRVVISSSDAGENRPGYVEHDKFTDKVVQTLKYHSENTSKGEEFFIQDPKHGRSAYMKDASTEITPSASHREIGTQMTPLGSSRTSRCPTPRKCCSPARHNTPARRASVSASSVGLVDLGDLENCHFSKLELQGLSAGDKLHSLDRSVSAWSSREEEEDDVGKSLRHFDLEDLKKSVIEARAFAWEEAERSKCIARYQREEARLQAWANHEKAKAEAELRKLEVKLEKMRLRTSGKIMSKLADAHRRAEEMRAAAEARQLQQMATITERAERMRRTGNLQSQICACFDCGTWPED